MKGIKYWLSCVVIAILLLPLWNNEILSLLQRFIVKLHLLRIWINFCVSSCSFSGLKTILTQLHNLKDNSYPLRNRHRSTRNITRLYKSCNDIFSVMDDEIIRCEMCIRYESSFICKRCQLANMQKKRKNTERNNMISDIEEKLRRNNTTKFGSVKNNLNKYSRSLLDLSLSSGLISRETSMMSLDDINTVNGRKRDVATLKELSIKGELIYWFIDVIFF